MIARIHEYIIWMTRGIVESKERGVRDVTAYIIVDVFAYNVAREIECVHVFVYHEREKREREGPPLKQQW